MAERKVFSGDRDTAVDYLGIGRNLLLDLRRAMQLNDLQVLQRAVTLANGVVITVASVFGQDEIRIDAPVNLPREVHEDVNEMVEELREVPPHGFINETITLTSQVAITKTQTIPATPGVPSVVLVTRGGGDSDTLTATLGETVTMGGSVRITITTTTYTNGTPPPPTPPSVFIAGGTQGGDAFVWDDVNGYRRLDKNDTFFGAKRYATVFGMSGDGKVLVGSVEIYDSNVNPATINPFTGAGGAPYGWIAVATRWATKFDQPQIAAYTSGGGASEARQVQADGSIRGVWAGSGMSWDGRNGHGMTLGGTVPARGGLTSPDGTVTVSNNNYTLAGQSKPWRGQGGTSAPSDAVPFCVVHVKNAVVAPTPPSSTQTVTTVVFSA